MLCLMTPAAPLSTKIPKGVFVTPSGRSQASRRRCGVGLPILGDNFLSKNEGVRVDPQACTKPALGHLRWAVWTAAPHPGTACWPTLPERDAFQHSQNSVRRSITPPCQNRGPAKGEMVTAFRRWRWLRTSMRSRRFRSLQWDDRLSAMEISRPYRGLPTPPTGFNGATAFRRASMGPPPFGDGYWGHRRVSATPWHRFNGATAFRRWIQEEIEGVPETGDIASMGPPPFGDGYLPHRRPQAPGDGASMGPPPFGDGYASWRQALAS